MMAFGLGVTETQPQLVYTRREGTSSWDGERTGADWPEAHLDLGWAQLAPQAGPLDELPWP